MAVLLTPPYLQFLDANGNPLANGKVYTYAAGTNTPKATFTTQAGNIANTNPVILDSAGRATIWIEGSYKFVVTDANDVTVRTTDNVSSFTTLAAASNAFFQSFSGNSSQTSFTLSEDLGTDEKALMVFVNNGQREHVTNGSFTTDTAWTKGAGWTIGSGVATATGAISTALEQDSAITLEAGKAYAVTYTITRSAGGVIFSLGGQSDTERTASGTYRATIVAGTTQKITFTGNGFTGTVDNVSVKEADGVGFQIQPPTAYTLNGTSLVFTTAPNTGTNNIQVYAPSTLVGAASAAAAAAAASEANAAQSEIDALAAKTAAEAAQTAAESARDLAQAAYDSFDDRYLGSKTSDPTTDNDGNALVEGALYWNSDEKVLKIYNGSSWAVAPANAINVAYTPSGTGAVTRDVQTKLRDTVSRADYSSDANYNTARNALAIRSDMLVRVEGGSANRLLSDKLAEFVSVRDFGAVGNGVTDDRPAFVAALTALSSGGVLFVPKGTYFIGAGRITVPSNVSIKGEKSTVLLKTVTGDDGIFTIAAGSTHIQIDIDMHGPYTETTPDPSIASDYPNVNAAVTINGVWNNRCKQIEISGHIFGWGNCGLFAENCDYLRFGKARVEKCGRDGVRLYGCFYANGDGFLVENITPGLSGSSPNLNAYGVTFTRRADRTNLLAPASWENVDDAAWTKTTGLTTSLNQVTNPYSAQSWWDSGGALDKIIEAAAGSGSIGHLIRQDVTIDPNQVFTASCIAKAGERSILRLTLAEGSSGDLVRAHFDLNAGTVLLSGVAGNGLLTEATITDLGDGVYLCRVVGRPDTTGTVVRVSAQMLSSAVSIGSGGSYTGDGASGLFIGGLRLASGNVTTNYDPLRQNPPCIGCHANHATAVDIPTWKGFDTHGGKNCSFVGVKTRDCYIGIGIDEGNSSGLTDCPPEGNIVDDYNCQRGSAYSGGAGIFLTSANGTTCVGRNNIIGSGVIVGHGGSTADGAITIVNQFNPVVVHPTFKDITRAAFSLQGTITGLKIHGYSCEEFDTDSGTITTIAALACESATVEGIVSGGAHKQTSNPYTAYSMAVPSAGYGIVIEDDATFEGTITRYASGHASRPVGCTLTGSATFDPSSLADGAGETTTVTVTGAVLGDRAEAAFSLDLQGVMLFAWVSAADTVSVRFQNETGGTVDLGSGTIRAWVTRKQNLN